VSDGAELKIKGALIKDPREWARTAYGHEAFQSALGKLTAEERAMVEGPLLAGSWYPVATWDRFLAAMREEARLRRGHSEYEFDMRNMREAGSTIARTIYKFILGLMRAQTVLEKAVVIYNRAYSEGHCELVENGPGRGVVRYCDASPALRTNLLHNFLTGLIFVLELNGVKDIDGRISRDEIVDGRLIFEVTITYRK
jgi:hypothetical protein